MSNFSLEYVPEPELRFAEGEARDPRAGLVKYGPRSPSSKQDYVVAKVGLVGSGQSISQLERLFEDMRHGITRDTDTPERWNPPFPGLGKDSVFKLALDIQKRWRGVISGREIRKVTGVKDPNKRYQLALRFVENKIRLIYQRETPPDIVIVALPEEIKEACTPRNSKGSSRIQANDSDFRSRIKLTGMQLGVPTQLIRPETLRGEGGVEDKTDIAWNLAVAILYKARKGHPWKLAHLENGTCYAGISFYQERGSGKNSTKASMAQVFLETGESFILRGDPVDSKISGPGNNHLSESDAYSLVDDIITQYRSIRGNNPRRLVLHKTSNFWDEEKTGFVSAADEHYIENIDLITVLEGSPLRLFTPGDYPVLRGTLATAPGGDEYHLYTKGFIPSLSTYPGMDIPKPIIVRPDPEFSDTPYQDICEEILAFTKMDWNTSAFCKKLPVTIEVSRAVGRILAESKARDILVDPHYYYYM